MINKSKALSTQRRIVSLETAPLPAAMAVAQLRAVV